MSLKEGESASGARLRAVEVLAGLVAQQRKVAVQFPRIESIMSYIQRLGTAARAMLQVSLAGTSTDQARSFRAGHDSLQELLHFPS